MALGTTSLSELLPLVGPHVAGLPRVTILHHIRLAASEWCKKTRAWRKTWTETLPDVDPGVAVDLTLPAKTTVVEFESVVYESTTYPKTILTPASIEDFVDQTGEDGPPEWFFQAQNDQIEVYPYTAGTLTLTAFLMPTPLQDFAPGTLSTDGSRVLDLADAANVVATSVINRDAEAIMHGALSRLLIIPKTDFTNPQLADYHRGHFQMALDAARAHDARGQQKRRLRSTAHWV